MNIRRKITQSSLRQKGSKASLCHAGFLIWMVMLLTMGCGSSKSHIISLTNDDSGRSVVVSVGDTIEVTLQTIGPGQYGDPIVSSGSIKFLEESQAITPIPAGPTQLYRFKVVNSGQIEIAIPHTDGSLNGPVIPMFTITIAVQ
jgi:hypothetical protein